jgi:hypothetical protein
MTLTPKHRQRIAISRLEEKDKGVSADFVVHKNATHGRDAAELGRHKFQ